jgi:hypothetical protein
MTAYLKRPEGRIVYDGDGEGPLVICAPGMGDLRSGWAATEAPRPGQWQAFVVTARTSHGPVEARLGEVRGPLLRTMFFLKDKLFRIILDFLTQPIFGIANFSRMTLLTMNIPVVIFGYEKISQVPPAV